jgi:hypothetical protein
MVDDALCTVGQGFTSMGGGHDIHKTVSGDILFCLQRQICGWENEDDPPTRVKPIPIKIPMVIISLVFSNRPIESSQAIVDMTPITLFCLFRPCEYTGTISDDAALRLCDLQLWIHNSALDVMTVPLVQLQASTSASLVFTT